MSLLAVVIFFLPSAAVFAVARFLLSSRAGGRATLLLQAALGAGIGLGAASSMFILWRILVGYPRGGYVLTETALAGAGLASALWIGRGLRRSQSPPAPRADRPWRLLSVACVLATSIAVAGFVAQSLDHPHGEWDAWATWNMRARVLFRADAAGNALIEILRTQDPKARPDAGADYPILVSSVVARGWTLFAKESQAVPALVGFVFTFSTAALLIGSLALLRTTSQALIGGTLLLGTQLFDFLGGAQYSDVPMAYFILATLVLVALYDELFPERIGLLWLAGIAAGLTAWTKNEGILYSFVFIAVRAVVVWWREDFTACRRQIIPILGGALPVLLMVAWFKLRIAAPDVLIANPGNDTWLRLIDVTRYSVIAGAFGRAIAVYGQWSPDQIKVVPLLLFWFLLIGFDAHSAEKTSRVTALLILSAMLFGYGFVYLVTPYDLRWQLDTSLIRLLTQLWPSALWTALLLVRPFETAAAREIEVPAV